MGLRKEKDSLGEVFVPEEAYYGAQTARSMNFFSWGHEVMPEPIIHALALIKKCAALANRDLGLISERITDMIVSATDDVLSGQFKEHFPLKVWQTGSGTQSNMNMNEVISNLAIKRHGGILGSKTPVHPNDHVNLSQSSNDVYPTAMHIAVVLETKKLLIPAIEKLKNALKNKSLDFKFLIKIGRTHLMDAVPMTLGQEFSGYVDQIEKNLERIEFCLTGLYELAIGATAVGTGINVPKGFIEKILYYLSKETNEPFVRASNYFSALSCHDALVFFHSALVTLSCSLTKIATDLAFLGSGPRCGFHELIFPENEPGSSIMPGKINPTQCEAVNMVCAQVMGNNQAVIMGGSRGNFELNVFKPVIAHNCLQSITLLSDAMTSFAANFVFSLKANEKRLNEYVNSSLMLVTALSPKIGYDNCSKIALKAFHDDLTLKEACLILGFLSEEDFDALTDPKSMVGNL